MALTNAYAQKLIRDQLTDKGNVPDLVMYHRTIGNGLGDPVISVSGTDPITVEIHAAYKEPLVSTDSDNETGDLNPVTLSRSFTYPASEETYDGLANIIMEIQNGWVSYLRYHFALTGSARAAELTTLGYALAADDPA
jgi:hypothetical protein